MLFPKKTLLSLSILLAMGSAVAQDNENSIIDQSISFENPVLITLDKTIESSEGSNRFVGIGTTNGDYEIVAKGG